MVADTRWAEDDLEGHPGTLRPGLPRSSGRGITLSYTVVTLLEFALTVHPVISATFWDWGLRQKTLGLELVMGTFNMAATSVRMTSQSALVMRVPLYWMAYLLASLATWHAVTIFDLSIYT